MTEHMNSPQNIDMRLYRDTPDSWKPELLRMARALLDAVPWTVVPPDPSLAIRIPSLGVEDGRVVVMGHNGEVFGFMLFFSAADQKAFAKVAAKNGRTSRSGLPRCLSVNLTHLVLRPGSAPETVASVMIFERNERRAPSEHEMRIATATTHALTRFVRQHRVRLRTDWFFGVEAHLEVDVRDARVEVELYGGLVDRDSRAALMKAIANGQRSGPMKTKTKTTAKAKATLKEKGSSATSAGVFTHTNRRSDTYYLHEGKTKLGKPRYFFALTVRAGALAAMPQGYEVSESMNGVVSVRRIGPSRITISDADVGVVETEVRRHAHLRYHRVRVDHEAIVVYAPDRDPEVLNRVSVLPMLKAKVDAYMSETKYAPVFRFVPEGQGYMAMRMTYRLRGGWSSPLGEGPLAGLARRFVSKIGTEEFFELI